MSNFYQLTTHPITGAIETAEWLDDYFGSHIYGVRFPDGQIFIEYAISIAGDKVNPLGSKARDSEHDET